MELFMLLLVVLLVLVAVFATRLSQSEHPFPFTKRHQLFSNAERNFLQLIERAVGDEFRIVNRVRLSDIVDVRRGLSKRTMSNVYAKASNRSLDFVLCDKKTMDLVAVIDLVQPSDKNKGYKEKKDWFLSGALDAANIPHIRIQVKSGYRAKDIQECIYSKLSRRNMRTPKHAGIEIPANMLRPKESLKPNHALAPETSMAH